MAALGFDPPAGGLDGCGRDAGGPDDHSLCVRSLDSRCLYALGPNGHSLEGRRYGCGFGRLQSGHPQAMVSLRVVDQ